MWPLRTNRTISWVCSLNPRLNPDKHNGEKGPAVINTLNERRCEPRKPCSVYVTFGTGFQVETAKIVDYSDSGLRLRTSGARPLGKSIEIIDSESPLFLAKQGRVVWEIEKDDGGREFGIKLGPKTAWPIILHPERQFDRLLKTFRQVALEEAFA